MWDSPSDVCCACQGLGFQFSMWDSSRRWNEMSWRNFFLSILYVRFLSQVNRENEWSRDFQFSMWDSAFFVYTACCGCCLSILYVRFMVRFTAAAKITRTFQFSMWDSGAQKSGQGVWEVCFQFSMWDSSKRAGQRRLRQRLSILYVRFDIWSALQEYASSKLSILYVRFTTVRVMLQLQVASFNSLCEILNKGGEITEGAEHFQFSMWDSYQKAALNPHPV